jgi:hypothetical protein
MGAGLPFRLLVIVIVIAIAAQSLCLPAPDRTTLSLNGAWQIENSKDARALPVIWNQKAPLSGMAHSADPAFPHVNEFDSRKLIRNRVSQGNLAKNTNVHNAGVSQQGSNSFRYRHAFEVTELNNGDCPHRNRRRVNIVAAPIGGHRAQGVDSCVIRQSRP